MGRKFKIFAAISDVHIGVKHIKADELKKQLKDHFFDPLDKLAYLDGIFVTGDTTHTILSLNSEYSNLFHWFIDKIYKTARKKGAVVIIVRGTMSHDNEQLNNVLHYCANDDGVDFRIYDTVEEITIWDNFKVLVLPDIKFKHFKHIDKYFKEPNKYDLILGHGTIDQMQFHIQETESNPLKTYVYKLADLLNACKGPILFGHIHQYQIFNNKFYYVGPFTLLERGSTDAGYLIGGISTEDHTKFRVDHYTNPDSADYYNIKITPQILDTIPIDDIIHAIDSILEECKSNDLVHIRITRNDSMTQADKVIILESRYRKDRRVSVVKKIKTKKEAEMEKINQERKEKYSYLLDKATELPIILYTYYNNDVKPKIPAMKREANLTEDDFRAALSEVTTI